MPVIFIHFQWYVRQYAERKGQNGVLCWRFVFLDMRIVAQCLNIRRILVYITMYIT